MPYRYFKRDISWLSFNLRVLLEATDESLPVYERIKFLSIYSSNLEEFYKVRVSGYHSSILKSVSRDESEEEALQTLLEINNEVTEQEKAYYRIFNEMILPELRNNGIILYQTEKVEPFHRTYVENYFNEEVFPYLQPMIILKDDIHSFIQDGCIYLVVSLQKKKKKKTPGSSSYTYAMMKIPNTNVPRFVELPSFGGNHYLIFIDDLIKANLQSVFPGYEIIDCYSIKISRDADFSLDKEDQKNIAERILRKVRKRKIGAVTRFQYDKEMPDYFLKYLCEAYEIEEEELLPSGRYLNLSDLIKLPNPVGEQLRQPLPHPLRVPELEANTSILRVLRRQDVLLHFPYQSFDYLLRFLLQAAFDPKVREIKVTQYRVAENSAVINSLISAAKNGKKVTVFVELKARFDEENNYLSSELMQQAGIKIIYSLPGLKVHAKLAYVRKRSNDPDVPLKGYAYLGTGNFNEKTARIYSDEGLLTSDKEIISDIDEVFRVLEGKPNMHDFKHLLVTQFNMVPAILQMIDREIALTREGGEGYIILKMNSLEDREMINALYRASEAGVKVDLIVRGICCLVPNQPYSKNIRITRIVDTYLEHARIWYFRNGGNETIYLSSADWMERNLHRRIEVAFPVYSEPLKRQIIDILKIQLSDNRSAVWVDEHLNNLFKRETASPDEPPVRAQQAIYDYLKSTTGQ
ncbi:MAG: polyphosphate kinase 1 [Petrimonas mucosa]|jgi:polyphosphate kinase|uniref:polyphosphate kinase 1 n=1 Tax=Petrimonas TaxID=307628 RepID=UPI0008E3F50A|nr:MULTISPECIES: polyphosphate kinase 1 [Petrimonas]MDD3559949.1 polyphosphate kinase 1 [Petrimonas mucosa]SFU44261.1 polyphosphate kinase [Porphyromonadaceae bacterium KHP3R9]HHT29287.1 polyphosphate kinase 1 [Petrimonas mucosa]